jgi:hypothetical protein
VSEKNSLTASQIEDLRFAAKKMTGASRRAFQAQICQKYFEGNARKTETVLGWGRRTVKLGLEEQRTGIICVGRQSTHSGVKKWEERHPEVAQSLREIAESHPQQNPTFKNPIAYTRLTVSEARKQLKLLGYKESEIPRPSTMAEVLNRMGYRLRKVVKAKPKKKSPKQMKSLTTSRRRTQKIKKK